MDLKLIISAVDRTASAWKGLIRNADNFKLKVNEVESALQSMVSVAVLYKLTSGLKGALDEAEKLQNSLKGLAGVARYNGVDIGQAMQAAAKLAEDGLMDIGAASKSLQNLLNRGFSLDESLTLLGRLKDSAAFNRAGQLSLAEAVQTATEGLKNENSILVDNAGVTKNVSVMWKEYADAHGKGVQQLTLAEKRQAEFNGILRETEAQAGNAQRALEGVTGAKAELSTGSRTLAQTLGRTLTPAYTQIIKLTASAVGILREFIGGIEILGVKAGALYDKAKLWAGGPSREEEIARVEKLLAQAEANKTGWRGKVLGADTYQKEVDRYKKELAEIKRRPRQRTAAEIDADTDAEIAAIIAKYEGGVNPPDIGPDSGRRRSDAGGGKGGPSEKELKAAANSAKGVTDLWQAQAADRYEVQSRTLDALQEKEDEAKKNAIDHVGEYTDLWQAQAADRYEVQSRGIDAIIEKEEEQATQEQAFREANAEADRKLAKDKLTILENQLDRQKAAQEAAMAPLVEMSRRTAEAMEQNFSDLFFDMMTNKFRSLEDFGTGILRSMQRATADYLGQLAKVGLFGDSGSGGLAGSLGKGLSGLFSGGGGGAAPVHVGAGGTTAFGMARGGVIGEHVVGVGLRSGASYEFGEGNRPEVVLPVGDLKRGGGGDVHVHLNYAPVIQAVDTRTGLQFLGQHKRAIVGMVESAFNKRGRKGPMTAG